MSPLFRLKRPCPNWKKSFASWETGKSSLEDAIGAYERGAELKKHCEKKLTEAKARVEKINLSAAGSEILEPADLE